jgi:hypothetical protein
MSPEVRKALIDSGLTEAEVDRLAANEAKQPPASARGLRAMCAMYGAGSLETAFQTSGLPLTVVARMLERNTGAHAKIGPSGVARVRYELSHVRAQGGAA